MCRSIEQVQFPKSQAGKGKAPFHVTVVDNLNNVTYFIQDLENTDKKRIEGWRLADQNSYRRKVSFWNDSSAFLNHV